MTFDEYFSKTNGKGIDYDGQFGVQCFDLVNDYAEKVLGCKPFTGMYAWEIYENFSAQPSSARFSKIKNTPDLVPKKGDIVVWAKSLNGKAGHCAVATGDGDTTWFTSYEQNWTGNNNPCVVVKHDYSHVLGVLRPKEQANIKAKSVNNLKVRGIDVSMHQGNIDFEKVKNSGVKFVIIRCNNWDDVKNCVVKDPYFEQNYKNAKAAGLDVGAYYYTWNTTAGGAMDDAALCMKYLSGKKFEYPIYFDLEWQKAFAKGEATCDAMVRAFCDRLEDNGYFAGLYISRIPLQTYISPDVASSYSLWIAEYGAKCNYDGLFGMWQYSDKGRVSGISGDVDLDECYVDYPKIVKEGGFNGYPEPEALKELDKPSEAWWKHGDKLDHGLYAVKCRMKALGYGYLDLAGGFGGGTEKAVNDLLRLWGYKQNGVIGEKFVDIVMK